jgi:hypothetical protein
MTTINEILKAAEDNIDSIIQHADNKYLRNLMNAAFNPNMKFKLPEGIPEYKKNLQHEQQLRGAFWQICKTLDKFNTMDIPQLRRESLFIQALESLPEVEATILKAVKEQNLHTVYKGVTRTRLKNCGYFKD